MNKSPLIFYAWQLINWKSEGDVDGDGDTDTNAHDVMQ